MGVIFIVWSYRRLCDSNWTGKWDGIEVNKMGIRGRERENRREGKEKEGERARGLDKPRSLRCGHKTRTWVYSQECDCDAGERGSFV